MIITTGKGKEENSRPKGRFVAIYNVITTFQYVHRCVTTAYIIVDSHSFQKQRFMCSRGQNDLVRKWIHSRWSIRFVEVTLPMITSSYIDVE